MLVVAAAAAALLTVRRGYALAVGRHRVTASDISLPGRGSMMTLSSTSLDLRGRDERPIKEEKGRLRERVADCEPTFSGEGGREGGRGLLLVRLIRGTDVLFSPLLVVWHWGRVSEVSSRSAV